MDSFTASPNQTEKKKLDGFQARCLRRILRIPHAYYSRISNQTVLEIAGGKLLSSKILQQQIRYMEKLRERPDEDHARACIFEPGRCGTQKKEVERKRSRPRAHWVTQVHAAYLKDRAE